MRNRAVWALSGVTILLILGIIVSAYATEPECVPDAMPLVIESNSVLEKADSGAPREESDRTMIENLLQNEEDFQHYAYMDLEKADASLHTVILAARRKIIFQQGWVADDINGCIFDKDGNLVEEVPHFSELFPADWDVPTVSTEINLSYYGIQK